MLILSNNTVESKAVKEELEYGIHDQGLPVIVIYPDYNEKINIADSNGIKQQIRNLWNKVPTFKKYMDEVATIHVPMKQSLIESALNDSKFKVGSMVDKKDYYYSV